MLKPPKLQALIGSHIQANQLTFKDIVQRMGYTRLTQATAVKRLEKILSKDDLAVTQSAYDFKYTSHEFVYALCQVVGLKPQEFEPMIERLKKYTHYTYNTHRPKVYADVNLPKPPQISIMLAGYIHGRKRVYIDDSVKWLDENQQIDIITKAIKKHYEKFKAEFTKTPVKGYNVYLNGRSLYFTITPSGLVC